MSDSTVHTPKTFSLEIEKIAFDKRCTHLDAISIYCELMGIDPVTVAKLITKSLKEKIEANARDLNYLPKSAKLPLNATNRCVFNVLCYESTF